MKHHEFSPSRLNRLADCPWSYKNCLGWVSPDTDDSRRGTVMHEAVHNDDVLATLPDGDAELIRQLRAEHVTRFLNLEHYFELQVEVTRRDGTLLTSGYIDFLYLSPDREMAGMVDWKFGSQEVAPAEHNWQMKGYAAGVFQQFPTVKRIFAMTVQPVFGMDHYDKQFQFERAMLPQILMDIDAIQERAKNATPADAHPAPERCRECNQLHCAKYRERMEENISLMQGDTDLPLAEQEMTLDFADRLLCAKREIEILMAKRAGEAKNVVIKAGGSEHFRVQSGRVTAKTDWQALMKAFRIPEEAVKDFTETTTGEPFIAPRMRRKKELTA